MNNEAYVAPEVSETPDPEAPDEGDEGNGSNEGQYTPADPID
jgi:hypothetical protein